MICEKCGKDLGVNSSDADAGHVFSGYGYMITYCRKCCPIWFDGMPCPEEHDEITEKERETLTRAKKKGCR